MVATLWYIAELCSEFERKDTEDWLLALQWDENTRTPARGGKGRTKPAVYSGDNAAAPMV